MIVEKIGNKRGYKINALRNYIRMPIGLSWALMANTYVKLLKYSKLSVVDQ